MSQGYLSWAKLTIPPHTTGAQSVADAEAVTAADAPSNIATLLSSLAESTTTVDTGSGVSTLLAARAETATAADSPNAATTWPVAVAEQLLPGNGTETPSATATYAATVPESATASDSTSSGASILSAAVAEQLLPGNGTETPSAISTLLSARAETLTAADSPSSGASTLSGPVSESLAATDAPSNIATLRVAVAETASAADLASFSGVPRGYLSWAQLEIPSHTLGSVPVDLAETLVASDAITNTRVTVHTETLTATATQSAGQNGFADVAEVIAATDLPNSVMTQRVYLSWADLQLPLAPIVAALPEALTATDTTSNVGVIPAGVGEVTVTVDAASTLSAYLASMAEATAVTAFTDADIVAATGSTVSGTAAEGITAADSLTNTTDAAVALVEVLSAAESADAMYTLATVETLTPAETCDGLVLISGSIAEDTASPQDVSAVAMIWAAFTAETCNAVDFSRPPTDTGVAEVCVARDHCNFPGELPDMPPVSAILHPSGARLGHLVEYDEDSRLGK